MQCSVTSPERRMKPAFDADIERSRARLEHFIFVYGWSARRIGVHLRHDPTMVHRIIKGETVPRIETRQALRQFMRRYRKSEMI